MRFLREQDAQTPYFRIILVYSFDQPLYAEYRKHFADRLLMMQNITEDQLRDIQSEGGNAPSVLVLDDRQWQIKGNEIASLLGGASHHYKFADVSNKYCYEILFVSASVYCLQLRAIFRVLRLNFALLLDPQSWYFTM